ncbi:MAG: hypothetical protein Q9162_006683, partial [Coniocarpon cinnabarinum]
VYTHDCNSDAVHFSTGRRDDHVDVNITENGQTRSMHFPMPPGYHALPGKTAAEKRREKHEKAAKKAAQKKKEDKDKKGKDKKGGDKRGPSGRAVAAK